MPRELSEKDVVILKKLAPECGELTCSGSGHSFHSILPPVSNHFSEDSNDFIGRIGRLDNDELTYITDMIIKGEESMGCLPVEDVEALVHLVMTGSLRRLQRKLSMPTSQGIPASTKSRTTFYGMDDIARHISGLGSLTAKKRIESAAALGKLKNPATAGPLGAALDDPSIPVRLAVVLALGKLEDSESVPFLIRALDDPDASIRAAAIAGLGRIRDTAAAGPLITCLKDRSTEVRIGATIVLGRLGDRRALGPLQALQKDPFSEVRDAAVVAMKRLDR
jgi:hypothetical protein